MQNIASAISQPGRREIKYYP